MFYGQNGHIEGGIPEDQILAEHFGNRIGRFLDVGSWSGTVFSNVRHFAEVGWSGVCIEPAPAAFLELMKNYADLPKVVLVNAAVSDGCRLADFYDAGSDAVSTLSNAHREKWSEAAKFRPIVVSTTTPGRLIDRFGSDFTLLSVDVEGGSADLLKEFPIGGMPKLAGIVVEHDNRQDELSLWASQWGFTERARTNENLVLVR